MYEFVGVGSAVDLRGRIGAAHNHVVSDLDYEVATISKLLEITDVFCKRALLKRLHSAKETYDFKGPTHRSQPIAGLCVLGYRSR